tara:strand:- start:1889 stop:2191 length:303 start_codon:yes stop_codon:yes gene_type:complete
MKKVLVVLAIFSTLFVSCIDEISGSFEGNPVSECDSVKLGTLAQINNGSITWGEAFIILDAADCGIICSDEQRAIFDSLDSLLEQETFIRQALSEAGLGC